MGALLRESPKCTQVISVNVSTRLCKVDPLNVSAQYLVSNKQTEHCNTLEILIDWFCGSFLLSSWLLLDRSMEWRCIDVTLLSSCGDLSVYWMRQQLSQLNCSSR